MVLAELPPACISPLAYKFQMTSDAQIIDKVRVFVTEYFQKHAYDPSHDMHHVERVYRTAIKLAQMESLSTGIDMQLLELSALLHDIGDFKYTQNENAMQEIVAPFLLSLGIDQSRVSKVIWIIDNISYRKEISSSSSNKDDSTQPLKELACVQDADRLDAIGALGIARCFTFGAVRSRPFYDPEVPPITDMNRAQYDDQLVKNKSVTLNHFDEKLFKLKDKMKTHAGRQMAEQRHEFMHKFVDQFKQEWYCL